MHLLAAIVVNKAMWRLLRHMGGLGLIVVGLVYQLGGLQKSPHSVCPGLKPRIIDNSLDAGLKAGSTRTSTCSEFP